MNFKIYDILSTLIPGFLVLSAIMFSLGLELDTFPALNATVFAYLIGFLTNSISSWSEGVLFFTWGGKPSDKLLNGKGIWKVKFYEWKKVKTLLKKELDKKSPTNDELFNIAMRYAFSDKSNTRVCDFNGSYAFSRSILLAIVISSLLLFTAFKEDAAFYAISVPAILISWIRSKQRGYYFSKEVLNAYLNKKPK